MMTVKSIDPAQRTAFQVRMEARSLAKLIERRNEWLNDPDNRESLKYSEVKMDTVDMTIKYQELMDELKELEKE